MRRLVLLSAIVLYSCGEGGGGVKEEESFVNPEPNIPLECYTDTGIVRYGKAIANPCYVCHTQANTPLC
jgi:hypothetical protein